MEEDESRVTGTNASEDESAYIVPVTDAQIRSLIYIVRGHQVMLDSDLAELYGVETKVLNQAVSRNPRRFPEGFCFRLAKQEVENLKSQIVTSSEDGWGGRRKPPRVFTEQGVSMLSAVLRSNTAIDVSVRIMNAFVEMRHFIASNATMFGQIRDMERHQIAYQQRTDARLDSMDERFERVFDYMDAHEEPTQKVFFEGQVWDAFELLVSLVQRAKESIILIDGYTDAGTLNILAKKNEGVAVTIWTHPKARLTAKDVETFNAQYPELTVRRTESFHDRFLILDGMEACLVGASLKDAGKKAFGITRIEDNEIVQAILERLGQGEDKALPRF
ncbi:ORF6N domain-containing protein [Olsenella sp. Marseille-P4559]|uniref:ORF6N domain-containing protein n=1 Tax=Olsenella sp. Marseille-P4559 TaxID=2364795 RepID=UPI001030817E|nr:ORF6N domain-containing protein [Olsenella sp. Marseille-P4559]